MIAFACVLMPFVQKSTGIVPKRPVIQTALLANTLLHVTPFGKLTVMLIEPEQPETTDGKFKAKVPPCPPIVGAETTFIVPQGAVTV